MHPFEAHLDSYVRAYEERQSTGLPRATRRIRLADMSNRMVRVIVFFLGFGGLLAVARAPLWPGEVHVWEMQQITLESAQSYANPYADVVCWIELEGPGFARRVHGFWDGGRTFKVRFVATVP